MDHYKETFETWNKVASLYETKFMDLDTYNETYDFICEFIKINEAKLLEIGCDGGSLTISRKCINGIFFFEVSTYLLPS